jgi:hypothetical protein
MSKSSNDNLNKAARLNSNSMPKRLFTIKEAAVYLGRGVWGVRDLIWKGILPVVKNRDNGKKLFIDIEDLNKFIDQNKSIYH